MSAATDKSGRSSPGRPGREASRSEAGKYFLVISVALVVVVLDQLTKIWVDTAMTLYQSIPVVDGFVSLTYVRNTGAAFSLLADMSESYRVPFFTGVALIAIIVMLYFVRGTAPSQTLVLLACGLVLGGAVGNVIDRLAYGSVIDFIDVYYEGWHWPAFNVADSAITVGALLLLGHSFFASE